VQSAQLKAKGSLVTKFQTFEANLVFDAREASTIKVAGSQGGFPLVDAVVVYGCYIR